ncbi:hypothetical protein Droror1_Dr00017300 [Drosera rotundifolia]
MPGHKSSSNLTVKRLKSLNKLKLADKRNQLKTCQGGPLEYSGVRRGTGSTGTAGLNHSGATRRSGGVGRQQGEWRSRMADGR